MQHILVLAGRILLALMFITAGYPKLLDPSGTAGMISGAGLPAATLLAYLAGLFELVAGLFILVGFRTKITALLLAAFCVFTALVFHSGSIHRVWGSRSKAWRPKSSSIIHSHGYSLKIDSMGASSRSTSRLRSLSQPISSMGKPTVLSPASAAHSCK